MRSLLLTLLLLLPLPALADDAVVFMADEADMKAFDQMLAEQQKTENFGKTVSQKARSQDSAGDANALGQWVSEQRKFEKANVQSQGQARSSEVRALVSDKTNNSVSSGNNPGKGHGNKDK